MKRFRVILVSLVAVAGVMGLAYGGNTDSLNIKVTLATNVEVNIVETEYNFQTLAGGETSVSGPSGVTVQNTSTSNREDWELKLADSADWTAITQGTPGEDQFLLMAQFGASAGAWTSANHALSTTSTDCSVSKFGNNTYGECGLDVSKSGSRSLWFRITMPSYSGKTPAEQTIPVTVTAKIG